MPKNRKTPAAKRRIEQFNAVIGQNIKTLRTGSNLTLQDIADHLHLTYQQVQKYETGMNRLPLQYLPVLCDLFGVPAEVMLAGLPGAKAKVNDDIVHVQLCVARVQDRRLRDKIIRVVDILAA
jgi:transcriptional regulator with XRE-family HTH domain